MMHADDINRTAGIDGVPNIILWTLGWRCLLWRHKWGPFQASVIDFEYIATLLNSLLILL